MGNKEIKRSQSETRCCGQSENSLSNGIIEILEPTND